MFPNDTIVGSEAEASHCHRAALAGRARGPRFTSSRTAVIVRLSSWRLGASFITMVRRHKEYVVYNKAEHSVSIGVNYFISSLPPHWVTLFENSHHIEGAANKLRTHQSSQKWAQSSDRYPIRRFGGKIRECSSFSTKQIMLTNSSETLSKPDVTVAWVEKVIKNRWGVLGIVTIIRALSISH